MKVLELIATIAYCSAENFVGDSIRHYAEWFVRHIGHSNSLVLFQPPRLARVELVEVVESMDPQHVVFESNEHHDDLRSRCDGFLGLKRCASLSLCSIILHRLTPESLAIMQAGGIFRLQVGLSEDRRGWTHSRLMTSDKNNHAYCGSSSVRILFIWQEQNKPYVYQWKQRIRRY